MIDEPIFKRMLSLERRRSEREGTRFALMLIDLEDLDPSLSTLAMEKLGLAVSAAMRETDIVGWYRQASIIGVILTALNGADIKVVESIVVARTKRILSPCVDPIQMGQIGITCYVFPDDDLGGPRNTKRHGEFRPGHETRDTRSKVSSAIKRAVDVTGSLAALVVLAPVFLMIALLIKLTSNGPVFFRQTRIGRFGEEFTFLKFRSMVVNNDPAIHRDYVRSLIGKKASDLGGAYKIKNDPRVTAIGKFLRRSSLDELPQFINVLRGEMSLVGPRPPIPYEFESYALWHRRRILEAKPGITGAWQVDGRSRTTFDDMVRMDLRYIRNQSLWLDIKILLKTPFAVMSGNGAF